MTRERLNRHTLTVRFSRRLLPGRPSSTGSAPPLLPKAVRPSPEKRGASPRQLACSRHCPPSRQPWGIQSP